MTLEGLLLQLSEIKNSEFPPDDGAFQSTINLLNVLDGRGLLPSTIQRGYWPTICLSWEDRDVEVEVFEGSYELLIFFPDDEKRLFDVFDYDECNVAEFRNLVNRIEGNL